jgi:uncharacterized protein
MTNDVESPDSAALTPDEKNWAVFCHLAGFAGFLVPFGNIIGPLVIWLIKKDQTPFVDHHGKEAVNFQITVTIALFVSLLLIFVVIGFILLPLIAIATLVLMIVAAVAASRGEYYRYPFKVTLIR